MSHVSDIRLRALDAIQENRSWAADLASGFNIYAYAAGDPVNGADPSGLAPGDGTDHESIALGGGGNGTDHGGGCNCEDASMGNGAGINGSPDRTAAQNQMEATIKAEGDSLTKQLQRFLLANNVQFSPVFSTPNLDSGTFIDVSYTTPSSGLLPLDPSGAAQLGADFVYVDENTLKSILSKHGYNTTRTYTSTFYFAFSQNAAVLVKNVIDPALEPSGPFPVTVSTSKYGQFYWDRNLGVAVGLTLSAPTDSVRLVLTPDPAQSLLQSERVFQLRGAYPN